MFVVHFRKHLKNYNVTTSCTVSFPSRESAQRWILDVSSDHSISECWIEECDGE